jgi:hypothetical protein
MNLPDHSKDHLQKWRKLGWMILGLIAPEMVVWNAWEQRKKMKNVSKLMQERGFMPVKRTLSKRVREGAAKVWHWTLTCLLLRAGELPEFAKPTPYRRYNGRIHLWTDVHSWLVVMGGLAFEDSAEEEQQFMPNNHQRMNITVGIFEYLLEMRDQLIPDISRETIQDKSKSDRLAKLLTCWQAGYFCIQCVSRLSQQLSVTLLELNVFAHALCALALFVVWSDKPRDVCEPTLVVGQEAMDICAICALSDDYFHEYVVETSPELLEHPLEITHPTSFSCLFRSDQLYYGALHDCCTLKVLVTHWVLRHRWFPNNTEFSVTLNARDFRRLQRASEFVQRYGIRDLLRYRGDAYTYPVGMRTLNRSLEISRALSFMAGSRMTATQRSHAAWIAAGATFAGTCYGGLHLVAWTTPFASHAEALLWRAASTSIMVAGPFFVLFVVCWPRIMHACRSVLCGDFSGYAYHCSILCTRFTLSSLIFWYIFCRVFIIVESFIMLAHIPDQALQVPTWSAYVPHIV